MTDKAQVKFKFLSNEEFDCNNVVVVWGQGFNSDIPKNKCVTAEFHINNTELASKLYVEANQYIRSKPSYFLRKIRNIFKREITIKYTDGGTCYLLFKDLKNVRMSADCSTVIMDFIIKSMMFSY